MKTKLTNLKDLDIFASNFIDSLEKKEKANVVGLHGNLGAGKTTFVQSVSKILGIKENLTSPTYVILKNYEIPSVEDEGMTVSDDFFKNLIHIDAYRLDKAEELQKLNWDFYKNNPDNLILIEWAEKVSDILPEDTTNIYFETCPPRHQTVLGMSAGGLKKGEEREVEVR